MEQLFHRIRFRLRALFFRSRFEREMEEEMRAHLEQEAAHHHARGADPAEARRAARVRFGGVDAIQEECRESWGVRLFDTVAQDLRFAWRGLRRNPGHTAAMVVTLGLGIGANVAVFSMVRGVLLRPLPYDHGDRVVLLEQHLRRPYPSTTVSLKEAQDYREQNGTLETIAESGSMSLLLTAGAEPTRMDGDAVGPGYFELFKTAPALGRTLEARDQAADAEPVIVLHHRFWRQHLRGDPNVVGRTLHFGAKSFTVAGVLRPQSLPHDNDGDDAFVAPLRFTSHWKMDDRDHRGTRSLRLYARLKPGVTLEQAQKDTGGVLARMVGRYPESYAKDAEPRASVASVREILVANARRPLLLLLGTTLLLLALACVNVATLAVARAGERSREIAVRGAIGAGRGRVLQQLLVESLLLSALGAGAALVFGVAAHAGLVQFVARFTPRAGEIQIDGAFLVIALTVSAGAGLAIGAVRALSFDDLSPADALGGEGRSTAAPRQQRLRTMLLSCQVALSLVLLIGAALLLRSFAKLARVDGGFQTEQVLIATVHFDSSTRERRGKVYDTFCARFLEEVRVLPGVLAAGHGLIVPLQHPGQQPANDIEFKVEARGGAPARAMHVSVGTGYFEALRVPLLKGRFFTADDGDYSRDTVLVNAALAKAYMAGIDPVGARLAHPYGGTVRIVGVVGDMHYTGLDRPAEPAVHAALPRYKGFPWRLVVRTSGDPKPLAAALHAIARRLDSGTLLYNIRTLDDMRDGALDTPRLMAGLLGLFAALAATISLTGVAGVAAYTAARRTREMAVRLTLGAEPRTVLALLLRQSLAPVAVGALLGLAGALTLSGALQTHLFSIEPTDPATFGLATVALVAGALLAAGLVAWRAARANPAAVLRAE